MKNRRVADRRKNNNGVVFAMLLACMAACAFAGAVYGYQLALNDAKAVIEREGCK